MTKTIAIHPPIGNGTPLGDAITAFLSQREEVAILMLPAENGGGTDDDDILEDVIHRCPENVVLFCHEDHSREGYAIRTQMVDNGQFFEDKLTANVIYCLLFKDGYDDWHVIAVPTEHLAWMMEETGNE